MKRISPRVFFSQRGGFCTFRSFSCISPLLYSSFSSRVIANRFLSNEIHGFRFNRRILFDNCSFSSSASSSSSLNDGQNGRKSEGIFGKLTSKIKGFVPKKREEVHVEKGEDEQSIDSITKHSEITDDDEKLDEEKTTKATTLTTLGKLGLKSLAGKERTRYIEMIETEVYDLNTFQLEIKSSMNESKISGLRKIFKGEDEGAMNPDQKREYQLFDSLIECMTDEQRTNPSLLYKRAAPLKKEICRKAEKSPQELNRLLEVFQKQEIVWKKVYFPEMRSGREFPDTIEDLAILIGNASLSKKEKKILFSGAL